MAELRRTTIPFLFLAFFFVSAGLQGQTYSFTPFKGPNGGNPTASPVQGRNGNLYGTTTEGGAYGSGIVVEVTPGGKLTTLYNFCSQANCSDGIAPWGGLVLAANGNFYGTTVWGGANDNPVCNERCGTVFEITPAGQLTTLYSFCSQANCTDGAMPYGGLVQGVDGNFYGTTYAGGVNCASCGTVFKITSAGALTTIYNFCSQANCSDGQIPFTGLILGNDGNFYGTTLQGGLRENGTLFKISSSGQLTTIHRFCSLHNCEDGWEPSASLVQGSDGNLYGTTPGGGAHDGGVAFQVTAGGQFTTLYAFCQVTVSCLDGSDPLAPLIQATDGNLYGTTYSGGLNGGGEIYEVTSSGEFTILYNFCMQAKCLDGGGPNAGLTQATNGTFYGGAEFGGHPGCDVSCGSAFAFATGLAPFVQPNPRFGKVGWTIGILGNNLLGTTGVTFNGTPATFTVISNTFLNATVQSGTTTGTIQVLTPGGTLSSNGVFRILP
jgi:uncharacterized repeat protein (TIGR03803 family)